MVLIGREHWDSYVYLFTGNITVDKVLSMDVWPEPGEYANNSSLADLYNKTRADLNSAAQQVSLGMVVYQGLCKIYA